MADDSPRPTHWWREPQVFWLAAFVFAAYFVRLDALELRGEETRRAQVAVEMLETGDWIVPRLQGQIYVTRPPLGNWLIAVTGWIRGGVDVVAIRLPSLLAILLTTVLIYGYCRGFLTRFGAFAAAIAYPSMAQVIQIGRLAETEAVFTLLTSASLLVWHRGCRPGGTQMTNWIAGYSLAALAGLTKGAQGPIYFFVPVVAYLLLRRDWRCLFSRGHVAGAFAFVSVLSCWQVPYYLLTDWETSRAIWTQQASSRFVVLGWGRMLRHLLTIPWEVAACMLPWSLAAFHVLHRRFYRMTADIAPQRQFLIVALLTTFPTLWFAVSAEPRYFMPLYPVAAALFGVIVERSLRPEAGLMSAGWRLYLRGCGVAGVAAAIALVWCGWSTNPHMRNIAQSALVCGAFLTTAIAAAIFSFRAARTTEPQRNAVATALIAGMVAFGYAGIGVNSLSRQQRDFEHAVAAAREKIPHGTQLVSFGKISHRFCYKYGGILPRREIPQSPSEFPDVDYFCIRQLNGAIPSLPFRWTEVARVSITKPTTGEGEFVIIGRRMREERPPGILAKRGDESSERR